MEEDYELISRNELRKLREENKKLKELLKNSKNTNDTIQNNNFNNETMQNTISQIIETIHEESTKERELILENLEKIKHLNKTTLDNLLNHSDKIEDKIDNSIDTVSSLVENLITLIDSINNNYNNNYNFEPQNNKNDKPEYSENINKTNDDNEILQEKILKIQSQLENINNNETESFIIEKLLEIEEFLKNLKTLLGSIKANDFK